MIELSTAAAGMHAGTFRVGRLEKHLDEEATDADRGSETLIESLVSAVNNALVV